MVVAPLPHERYRMVATVDEAPDNPSTGYMQQLLDARGPRQRPARILDMVWSSRFRVHHRVAETPRQGRVLLCGDAAHVHSPAGGQGMNTGIQDAMSVAEVLDAVTGGAADRALDAWATRRHQVAAEVVTFTDRMTGVATLGSPATRSLRNAVIRAVGHLPFLTHVLAGKLAELDRSRPEGQPVRA